MQKALSPHLDPIGILRTPFESAEPDTDARSRMFAGVTVLFGVVWLIDAAIQASAWLFAPNGAGAANLLAAFESAHHHAPVWLKPLLATAIQGIHAVSPTAVAILMVAIAAALGIGLVARRKLETVAIVGIAYSLVCWVFLDALGFPYAGGQTDPGVFIPYAIAFLFVLSFYSPRRGGDASSPDPALWNAARLAFALLWAFDAALKWLPAFMFHFSDQITGVIPGQPVWVADWLRIVAAIVAFIGPVLVAVIVGLVETAIAAGLLVNRLMIVVLPVGIAYSLSVWATAEAFGGPFTSAGTGVRGNVIGNVIIYLIPFFFLGADLLSRMAQARRNGEP